MPDRTDPPAPLVVSSRGDESRRWLTCPHGLSGARCCLSCWEAGIKAALKTALGDCQKEIDQLRADLREYMEAEVV